VSRQYFQDVVQEPVLADILTYSTVTTEAMLWPVAFITPIPAFDARPGKLYKLTAGGIITMPATTGSITLTPRWGQSATVATNVSMGASAAQFSAVATTNRPWTMELHVLVRSVSVLGGANSTVIGWGDFKTQGVVTAGGATILITMGGTVATVDIGISTGIGVSIIWGTTAGSIATQFAVLQSLN
jgi:hypothetical protein